MAGDGFWKRNALWLALCTGIISGFSIYVNKLAVTQFNPMVFSFLKNILVGGVALCAVIVISKFRELRGLEKGQWARLAAIGVIGGGIPFLLFFYGLKLTSALNAGFLQKTLFIFASVFALVFLKEKVSRKTMLAMAGMLAGIIALMGFGFTSFGFGDILILIGAVLWALELILSKRALERLSPSAVIFGRMFFGAMTMLAFLALTGSISIASIAPIVSAQNAYWLAITTVFLAGYVFTLYSALKHRGVSIVTTMLVIGVPITTLLGASNASPLTAIQGMGIAFVALAAAFALYNEARQVAVRGVAS